ncbi:MAG: hypothetical protein J6M53_06690 [Bacteroidaceae bacterium]|nr:hypothetical protein [Bacteroidaceae bacterium]
MKTLRYRVGSHDFRITLRETDGSVVSVTTDGQPHRPPQDAMPRYAAAISLALLQYEVEEVHDDEPQAITITHNGGTWNTPAEMFNSL